jgi:hypothetical protein
MRGKSEYRNPKSEGNPNAESRNQVSGGSLWHEMLRRFHGAFSEFGVRNSFGFRISGFGFLGSAAALLCLLNCSACKPSAKPPPPASDVFIEFTCDSHGRLVPCGCFSGQYGGLTRLKTMLDFITNSPALRLDVGDAIGGKEDYHVLEYRQILKAYALMQYGAVNIGHREAQLSAEVLHDLKRTSPVPILSANLREIATGKNIFEPYRIVQCGAVKVAVLGVVDPRGLGESIGEGLVVEKMESVLARLLPEVRPQADLVVLLAFADEATLAALAQDFYELDVILGGKVRQPAQKLDKVNRSLIYYTSNEARTLGLLWVQYAGRNKINPVKNDILFLRDSIPQSADIEALARQYRETVRGAKLSVDTPERLQADMVPGVRAAAVYAGSDSCLECHPAAARLWKKSAHYHAFNTLIAKGAEADPKCVGCHSVGFGSPSGYRREYGRARLVDVGCESCHGPGSLHVREQSGEASVSFKFRPLGAGDCQKCHYGEFSRPFNWDNFWPAVAHGGETNGPAGEIRTPNSETRNKLK